MYQPKVVGAAKVTFADTKTKVSASQSKLYLTPLTDAAIPVTWDNGEETGILATDLEKSAQDGAQFSDLPPAASQAKNYAAWNKDFTNWLYGTQSINLFQSPGLKLVSQPGEDERDFRIRAGQVAREIRDELVEALRKKYAPKTATLQERLRKAQAAVEKQQEQARHAKMQTALSIGATLLGAFTGRKTFSSSTISKATGAAARQDAHSKRVEMSRAPATRWNHCNNS